MSATESIVYGYGFELSIYLLSLSNGLKNIKKHFARVQLKTHCLSNLQL